ncbi:MAG: hypothetical protein GX996_06945 [Firmicutes bacterium]|nr:hypothetical protein [Bacillota bacterium]
MRRKRTRPKHLKVIEGRGGGSKSTAEPGKKPANFFLIVLALFLLAQLLFGWIWNNTDDNTINTVLASEGVVDISFTVSGVATFSEKVILAPCSGFVYYEVEDGERVPVGKKVAIIADLPLEGENVMEDEEHMLTEPLQQFKTWFLGEKDTAAPLFAAGRKTEVAAPQPGLVKLEIDGFEGFGPDTGFPYLMPGELEEKTPDEQVLYSGKMIHCSAPLLKILNNYYWYFSTILPSKYDRLLTEESQIKFLFSFAPDMPVEGRKVEEKERDDGQFAVTWCIDRELPGLYKQRLCSAEVVYKKLEGVLVPKSALLEIDDKTGVYILENGLVTFREIVVLMEKEDDFLVKNLELHEKVFMDPENVKEGQRFYW